MFDPRLTIRLWGLRWATQASCVVVLAVVVGGVMSRLVRREENEAALPGWLIVAAPTFAALVLVLAGHEAVRAGVWRRHGAVVHRINLTLFGGSVEFTEGAPTPRDEAIGALTAFAVLAVTASVLAGIALLTRHAATWLRAPLKTIAVAAVALAALQAMPALHLDGGRVLHAWFWYLTDSATAATRAAAIYAHLVAAALLGVGIVLVARTGEWPFWGLAAAVAGLQLEGGARRATRRTVWTSFETTTTLRALTLPPVVQVSADTSVDDAVETLLTGPANTCLLVVHPNGKPAGILRLLDLRGTRRASWDRLTAAEIARPLTEFPNLSVDLSLPEALVPFDDGNELAVVEDEGHVIAVVTRASLLAAFAEHLRKKPSR
ncbi:MAG TPA: CBS domain-containing protein [Thermomicrobiales bacterium]|jgi:CBS domain-containing protein